MGQVKVVFGGGKMWRGLKDSLSGSPLYVPLRAIYRHIFDRELVADHTRMKAFYSQFFARGDLVFDVGANQGEYAEIFADIGARVIAIEPNADFRTRLMGLATRKTVTPEFCAVGDKEGTAILNVNTVSGYSTLLQERVEWVRNEPSYRDSKWTGQITVRVRTLDSLAKEHGQPVFIKLDVEGFEHKAINGMSFFPKFVSFEYGAWQKEIAHKCISELGIRGYRFNPIVGRTFSFDSNQWFSATEAAAWLDTFSVERAEYGDMFAKSPS
jgi:FkbM family methyltransferase